MKNSPQVSTMMLLLTFCAVDPNTLKDYVGQLSTSEKQQVSKQGTQNPEAYALYLKGRSYWNKRTLSDLETVKSVARLISAAATGALVMTPGWNANPLSKPATDLHEASARESRVALGDEGSMPELSGAIGWLNSAPLDRKLLRGKVVLVDFWTYTCINSLRPLPYVKRWAEKYKDAGLVVIGVHTPEFSFEKEPANVENALRELHVAYPVAIDSNHRIWRAFNNEYWPAQYLVSAKGRIRYHHFGEGDYGQIETAIRELLRDNGASLRDERLVAVTGTGVEAPPDFAHERSQESYLGYRQAERFASPQRVAKDSPRIYSEPSKLSLNHWGLSGSWTVGAEAVVLQAAPGKVTFRFHSRDLNLILAPTKDGKPLRFKVTLDGAAPGDNSGVDSGPDGSGEIREPRLYQLIRQKAPIVDRMFEIEFLDPGVQALDFTFG